ncbi:uncharacterized protein HHUB_3128 [Halobacterium hubeiense]|jgi:hypothetical protein|uniref:Uncharacterized protein n=2 Tax=Halobacterium TaxID=2239 RepID=A0A0U5H7C0_9EURY|nr:hypothetical protein [Halobacterium hubeiense]CQH60063.1 uncharacterized protein HHUB_3128 [Halobacterium hubeiense]
MYDEAFSRDWDGEELDREEAIWRAYALGVAAALGDRNPQEYRQLVAAAGRSLVEMAYDEGKSSAADLDSRLASGDADLDPSEFPSRERAVWSKLITYKQEEGGDVEPSSGDGDRMDLPELLDRIDVDTLPRKDLDRLRLPEFLSRK